MVQGCLKHCATKYFSFAQSLRGDTVPLGLVTKYATVCDHHGRGLFDKPPHCQQLQDMPSGFPNEFSQWFDDMTLKFLFKVGAMNI